MVRVKGPTREVQSPGASNCRAGTTPACKGINRTNTRHLSLLLPSRSDLLVPPTGSEGKGARGIQATDVSLPGHSASTEEWPVDPEG